MGKNVLNRGGGRSNSLEKTCKKRASALWLMIVSCVLCFGIVGTIFFIFYSHSSQNIAPADALSSGTTYYQNGSNFYTRTSATYYKCTNSRHSGTNKYSSSSSFSGTCYTYSGTCSTCNGDGYYYTYSSKKVSCSTTQTKSTYHSCAKTETTYGGHDYYIRGGVAFCRYCGDPDGYTDDPDVCYSNATESDCSTCNGLGYYYTYTTVICTTCNGRGYYYGTVSTKHSCSTTETKYASHNVTSYTEYTYTNIDTGATTTSTSSYSTASGYTISFNNNGGSGSMSSQYFLQGHSQALTSNTFTRTNYKFKGWATSSTGSVTYTNGQTLSSGSTQTLYAVWELQSFAVTLYNSPYVGLLSASAGGFENTGWRNGSYDTTHVRSGNYAYKVTGADSLYESLVYTNDTFTLDSTNKNHIFYVRYYGYQETLTSGGRTQVYWPEEEPSMGSINLGPAGQWNLYSYRVDRSNNACTAGKYFRIDFDNNKVAGTIWWDDFMVYDLTDLFGSGNEPSQEYCDSLFDIQVSSVTATNGSAMPTITPPIKTGYTFGGYYTGTNGTGTQYYTATGASARTCDLTGATTLYAKWTANTYTITYNSNGGEGTTANSSHTYGVSKELTANGYTKAGYRFLGWSTSSTATTATYTNGQSVSNLTTTNGETVTLYAVWQKIYTIQTAESISGSAGILSGAGTYDENTSVTLKAYAKKGYDFVEWLKDGAELSGNDTNEITISATSDSTYTAVFKEAGVKIYDFAIGIEPADEICGMVWGQNVTLNGTEYASVEAGASKGYEFAGWKIGGVLSTTYTEKCALIPLGEVKNSVIIAVFTAISTNSANTLATATPLDTAKNAILFATSYTLTMESNNASAVGVISSSSSYEAGANVTISAYAKKGYSFMYWLKDNEAFAGNDTNEISVVVSGDCTYTAVFKEAGAKIEGVAVDMVCVSDTNLTGVGCVGMSSCTKNDAGTSYVIVNAYAMQGYRFIGWAINGDLSTTYTGDTVFIPYSEVQSKLITAQFEKLNSASANDEVTN